MRRVAMIVSLLLCAPAVLAQDAAPTLAELWRDACLWEVGSNTEKVPAARQALIARGDEALAFLVPDMLDTKDTLVTRALSVVITGSKGAAVERLRAALTHEKPNVRRNAADLLGQLGDAESATAIAALLGDADTRGGALVALGALKSQDAVPAVVALLDRREGVKERERVLAAATLGGIGGDDAASALVATLSDDRAQVRYAAQVALEKLGSSKPLVPLLAPGTDPHARLHAIAALGTIGDAAAAPALLPLLTDGSAVVRGYAAEALGRLGRAEDRDLLRSARDRETDAFARTKLDAAARTP